MSLDARFAGLTACLPGSSEIIYGLRGHRIEARFRSAQHLNNSLAIWEKRAGRPLTADDLENGLSLEKDISTSEALHRFAVGKGGVQTAPPGSSLDRQESYWAEKLEEQRLAKLSRAEIELEKVARKRVEEQTAAERAELTNDAAKRAIAARFDRDNKLSDVLAREHVYDLYDRGKPLQAETKAKEQDARERARLTDATVQLKARIAALQAEEAALLAELNPDMAPVPAPVTEPKSYYDRFTEPWAKADAEARAAKEPAE